MAKRRSIPALQVRQWLKTWDEVQFNPKAMQAKPEPQFYLLALQATHLKSLTGIYRRSVKDKVPRAADPNIQRAHNEQRSDEIREFVRFGYPWCEMSDSKRKSAQFSDLRKPGWLPTAIVVNIIAPGDSRGGVKLAPSDAMKVDSNGDTPRILLPESFQDDGWRTSSIPPLEVIDGQHRLWAFDEFNSGTDFELPVVAFHRLDRSWQAYLFWSINITPKRIKQSLAFDLYPLLRTEEWLERFQGHSIYRETRAQELVEALWSHPSSPWYQRINMLGESGLKGVSVTQAAWIRSLMSTFVKTWEGQGVRIGGLFGAPLKEDTTVLPWNRAQQAAFLIESGNLLRANVEKSKAKWATHLRTTESSLFEDTDDPAFYGQFSLLSTDQGVRGFLSVTNDLCYYHADELDLANWQSKSSAAATDEEAVTTELKSLKKEALHGFLDDIASSMASYDWRTSATPDLSESERLRQAVYRGSSGYRELRRQLLSHLAAQKGPASKVAKNVYKALGFA